MVLLVDNYDSFSYNLYQLIAVFDPDIKVVRNDKINLDAIGDVNPDHIVISPGPGKPSEAGHCIEIVRRFHTRFPIMGICLGHQAIFEAFGGTVSYAKKLMHGKASEVTVDTGDILFRGLARRITAARYHSLAGMPSFFNKFICHGLFVRNTLTAANKPEYPVYGVQFHPESILTSQGEIIIENFLGGS